MAKSALAPHLRALREAGEYTQADLSKLLNIQRQTYCNYENNSRTPSIETIIDLADFYHITVDELVREGSLTLPSAAAPKPEFSLVLSTHEQNMLSEFRALPSNVQREILDFIRFKKSLSSCC